MQTEKLESLLQKLKTNKEKVPLEILKTKYKAAYEQLVEDIKREGVSLVKQIVSETPEWLKNKKVDEEQVQEISDIWDELYKEGDYARKIGRALFQEYSINETLRLANELRTLFLKRLEEYLGVDDHG